MPSKCSRPFVVSYMELPLPSMFFLLFFAWHIPLSCVSVKLHLFMKAFVSFLRQSFASCPTLLQFYFL